MNSIVHEIVLVFVIVAILLIIVHIFLDYKWKLDILHKIDVSLSKVNQRYRNDKTNTLNSISDEVQKFTRDWENEIDIGQSNYQDSRDDRTRRAMDDFFSRYNN